MYKKCVSIIPNIFDPNGASVEALQGYMNIRVWSPLVAAKAAKVRPGGSITFTTGARAPPGWGAGSAISIGAPDQLAKGLAVDLAPTRVNSIASGFVDTELFNSIPEEVRGTLRERAAQGTLVGHAGTAEELAEAYLFLMKCNYITGQRIPVEGGSLLKQ